MPLPQIQAPSPILSEAHPAAVCMHSAHERECNEKKKKTFDDREAIHDGRPWISSLSSWYFDQNLLKIHHQVCGDPGYSSS